MTMRRIAALLLAAALAAGLCAGCGDNVQTTAGGSGDGTTSGDGQSQREITTVYPDKDYGFQLEKPAAGEKVAIMHTSMGDVHIRFFPEAAPKAVENFLTHAEKGYYNGLTFHRVCNDFMIQGGDPKGNGTGGESIWGKPFADEFDQKLMNLRGSLSMANSGANTNGSQFFINQRKPDATVEEMKKTYDYDAMFAQYSAYYDQYADYYGEDFTADFPTVDAFINYQGGICPVSTLVPDAVWELYAKQGGNISLDGAWRYVGGHTVFGQVYAGMDVVDAIAAVETDDNDKPKTAVTVTSIEVTTYAG